MDHRHLKLWDCFVTSLLAMTYETDSMYIDFSSKNSVESREVSPGVVLDYDSDVNLE